MTQHQIELDAYFQDLVDLLIQQGQYRSVEEVIIAGLELLDLQVQEEEGMTEPGEQPVPDTERSPLVGRPVDLPEKVSVASLNTFMDNSLQELMDMLNAQEARASEEDDQKT